MDYLSLVRLSMSDVVIVTEILIYVCHDVETPER